MLFFMAFPSSANAFVIDQFHAALTEADQDYRSASFYLRTGNPGVALLELQALSDKWQTLSKTFSDQPPGPYAKTRHGQRRLDKLATRSTLLWRTSKLEMSKRRKANWNQSARRWQTCAGETASLCWRTVWKKPTGRWMPCTLTGIAHPTLMINATLTNYCGAPP